MSQRTDQVASTIRGALQELLARGLADPRIRGLITITSVRVSPDLHYVTAMVSVLPAEHAQLTLHGLNAASGKLRHDLGSLIRMRRIPELRFEFDESLKKHTDALGAISKAAEDLASRQSGADDERG